MSNKYNFATIGMPYLLRRLGGNRYILLNRYYMPLGINKQNGEFDYENHNSIFSFIEEPDEETFLRNSIFVRKDKYTDYYFYQGYFSSGRQIDKWNEYMERIKFIADAKTDKFNIPEG